MKIIISMLLSLSCLYSAEVSVFSWNGFTGSSRPINYEIEKYILKWSPDIIGLQEAGNIDGVKKLAEKLKKQNKCEYYTAHTSEADPKSRYVLALVSKFKIKKVHYYGKLKKAAKTANATSVKNITKIIISAELEISKKEIIQVFVYHAATAKKPTGHNNEAKALMKLLASNKNKNTIVIGDFNSRSKKDKEPSGDGTNYDTTSTTDLMQKSGFIDSLRTLHPYSKKDFIGTKLPKTSGKGSNQNKRIDYIFTSKKIKTTKSGIKSDLSKDGNKDNDNKISDHRAVWANIKF